MLRIRILLFVFISWFLTGCFTEETEKFDKIKKAYLEIVNSEKAAANLTADAEFLKRQIDEFRQEYTGSKYLIELENFREKLDRVIYNAATEKLYDQFDEFLKESSYIDYDEYKIGLGEIKAHASGFLNKFPNGPNTGKVKKMQTVLNEIEENLMREKFAFEELERSFKNKYFFDEAELEISEINTFLTSYPLSFKSDMLRKRIQDLEYVKFSIEAKKEVKTVSELNNLISRLKQYENKVRSSHLSDFENTMEAIENNRQNVLEAEYNNKISFLLSRMDEAAKNKANEIHTCGFLASDGISEIDKSKDFTQAGNRTELDYLYTFRMKGGFWCDESYITKVRVVGIISGDERRGVDYGITTIVEVSDYKI